MDHGCLNGVGMAHHDDALVRKRALQLLDSPNDAALNLNHKFTMGNPYRASKQIPLSPQLDRFQLRDGPSRPVAKIDFIERFLDLDLQAQFAGHRFSRLTGSFERAAENV